jgi:type III pantothenate kinase
MVLVLDVGNTHIVLGVYGRDGKLVNHWRVSSDRHRTEDEYGMMFLALLANAGIGGGTVAAGLGFGDTARGITESDSAAGSSTSGVAGGISPGDITGGVIASVVPPLTPILEKAVQKYFHLDPLMVGPGTKTGVNVKYENPKEVGPDRIAHAVAALHKYGGPAIVVDFGTATTFDAISKEGDYLGGAIAPGILTALDALFERAARLPRIELARPQFAIGKTTVQSMQSGMVYGFAGLADALIRRIAKEIGSKPHVIATGGLARMVAPESEMIQAVDPFLVLDGLHLIYRKNAESAPK